MRWWAVIGLAFLAGACAGKQSAIKPQRVTVSVPEIGTPLKAGVGDEMIYQAVLYRYPSVELLEPLTIGVLNNFSLEPGHYLMTSTGAQSGLYWPENRHGQRAFKSHVWSDELKAVEVYHDQDKVCAVRALGQHLCKSGVLLERGEREVAHSDSFQQSLIYSGRVGDTISIAYREFSGDEARPAYSNDVDYDLTESRQIAYRGALIEVIDADNRSITYVVRQRFWGR